MHTKFQDEVEALKRLSPDDLYQRFHEIQASVLVPKWQAQGKRLLGDSAGLKIKSLFPPLKPEVPDSYPSELEAEIRSSQGHDVLYLNCVLFCVYEREHVLNLAREAGFKLVLINDIPKDGSFHYDSQPEVKFFSERNETVKTDPYQAKGNKAFEQVYDWCRKTGWAVLKDEPLDYVYETDFEKQALVKMELGLELIEHLFGGAPSRFEELRPQLEAWCFHPGSRVTVKGCSRWMLMASGLHS